MLSYHQVHEAIAAKYLHSIGVTISRQSNILSKHWDNSKAYDIMKELFVYQGPTTLIKKE